MMCEEGGEGMVTAHGSEEAAPLWGLLTPGLQAPL